MVIKAQLINTNTPQLKTQCEAWNCNFILLTHYCHLYLDCYEKQKLGWYRSVEILQHNFNCQSQLDLNNMMIVRE